MSNVKSVSHILLQFKRVVQYYKFLLFWLAQMFLGLKMSHGWEIAQ